MPYMYYFYIDESGDSGNPIGSNKSIMKGSSTYLTLAGIVVDESEKHRVDNKVKELISKYFRSEQLEPNFKLHYNPLIQGKRPPYNQLTKASRFQLSNDVFAIIRRSDCCLLSRAMDLCMRYQGPLKDIDPKAHLLLVLLEDFHDFLEKKKSKGIVVFERLNKREIEKIKRTMLVLRRHKLQKFRLELNNILGDVQFSDPVNEPILQLADFFAYATQKMYVSSKKKMDRWKSIKHKYC